MSLIEQLSAIQADMLSLEHELSGEISLVPPQAQASARNLVHYIALRKHDLRPLQKELAAAGLSSLGRSEAHTLETVNRVLYLLRLLESPTAPPSASQPPPPVDVASGEALLERNTLALLGPPRPGRATRIMVTAPPEAATDIGLVRELADAGMDLLRINCAHDTPTAWGQMVRNVREATSPDRERVQVLFDLAGPKLRTGPVLPGPPIVSWRVPRDERGAPTSPARIFLGQGAAPPGADAALPLEEALLNRIEEGDTLTFRDSPGRQRLIRVTQRTSNGFWAACEHSAWVEDGTRLSLRRGGRIVTSGHATPISPAPGNLWLRRGDTLLLTRPGEPGRQAIRAPDGRVLEPARISCTLDAVFRDARAGERIFFDDGKMGGIIRHVSSDVLTVEIQHLLKEPARLRADKGINLPDSQLSLPALTDEDLQHLDFVAEHGDLVSLSFIREPQDVLLLHQELERRGMERVGTLLKIETHAAFQNLPRLLLAALRRPPVAIMVARGDLGVEAGFERLAEIQEEILWISESAHMPVVWATQVLERLTRKGVPSRAEVTDAAMSVRAECVMLNKGPYLTRAVRFLDDVLRRMQAHQHKKRAMLRELRWR